MPIPIIMPRQGQSVESCLLIEWLVEPGDTVEPGQAIAGIETDKATFEVEAPESGTILDLFFKPGDDIPVLTTIGAIGKPGEDTSGLKPGEADVDSPAGEPPSEKEPTAADAVPTRPPPTPGVGPGTPVSPRARKAAAAAGVDTSILSGSGPGGRVIERDVQAADAAQPHLSRAARDAVGTGGRVAPMIGSGLGGMVLSGDLHAAAAASAYRDEPLSSIRKIIARRMHESLSSTAQLTLGRSFDASSLLAFRSNVKAKGGALGIPNVTLNDMVIYATARVLARHPDLNAHFLGDKIRHFTAIHLGVAVDTPRGLMVPVVRDAHTMNLSAVFEATRPLFEAAQSGSISPDHLEGGTFTITNLGMMGVESFTPVLNPPEVGILGVCCIVPRPVMNPDGGVKHVPSINLCLTINHQVVDGAPAGRFLEDLVSTLEHFELDLAR